MNCSALGLLLLALLLQSASVRPENWELTCPARCVCKYYDNKKVVDCHDAGFSTLPSSLSSAINVLDLTQNKISSLDKYAFLRVNLLNLHKLILASNRIQEVHKDAFKNLSLVMDLDLSNNQIDKLHLETFTGMEKMRKLILDGNILSRLEAFQFPVLNRLQHLLINNCRLSYINTYAFANLEKIKSVSLRGNRLKVLEPDLFSSRPELKSVQLGDNLWNCDCKLKRLIHWIQDKKIGEAEVACHSPERMAGIKWVKLVESELACAPQILIPQSEIPISLDGNATLSCGARGEPLPRMKWILDGRLLTNHTELKIPFSESFPTVKFILHEDLKDGLLWTNLTVLQLGEGFMLHGYDQSSPFKCLVENPAKMVERNVTLVIGEVVESPIITGSNLDIYILIAIIFVGFLVLILIILICVCCCRRRRPKERPVVKLNGNDKAFMERNNILIVNPVEKPPRKNELYEKLPQADLELTDLTKGGHKNFEEMNYPEERVGRVRSPLTPLEEEEFEHVSQKLLNESLNTTATIDYSLQYPDLLDNVKFPRAVSPTQLSYHSLVNPLYSTNPEWRYSYVYPSEFTPNRLSQTMQPQLFQRPGYVTLPRRPRTSSVTSAPPSFLRHPLSPTLKLEPIYDTLGPRTTADGTSRTDLTRPMSRSMIDPYNPRTPLATGSPPSLPLHYVALSRDDGLPSLSSQSSTLPRSTPNLLEEKGLAIHFPSEDPEGRFTLTPRATIHNNLNIASPKETTSKIVPKGCSSSASSTPLRIKPALKNVANSINNNNNSNNNNYSSSNLNNNLDSANTPQLLNGSLTNTEGKESAASKKVPPKPPPKPSVKRLSVSSTASDVTSKVSQDSSTGGLSFQDEGPDGTEV